MSLSPPTFQEYLMPSAFLTIACLFVFFYFSQCEKALKIPFSILLFNEELLVRSIN